MSDSEIFDIIHTVAGLEGKNSSQLADEGESGRVGRPLSCHDLMGPSDLSGGAEENQLTSGGISTDNKMLGLKFEAQQAEIDKLRADIRRTEVVSDGNKIDNDLRQQMANMTSRFMICWCIFVGVAFFVYLGCCDGHPPVEAIIALLGTSTISIIGLVGFVVSGLFKSQKKE